MTCEQTLRCSNALHVTAVQFLLNMVSAALRLQIFTFAVRPLK
jgi:hypothetical protein